MANGLLKNAYAPGSPTPMNMGTSRLKGSRAQAAAIELAARNKQKGLPENSGSPLFNALMPKAQKKSMPSFKGS